MPPKNSLYKLLQIASLCALQSYAQATVSVDKNPESGLLAWTSDDNGFSIELIQLIPDFVRAIYGSHGFPKAEIERIANYCVFGSVIKNTSQKKLSYSVANWSYTNSNGQRTPVKTKTQWIDEWRKAGVTFSWTLLPDSGDFEVGDWQQGFTTIKLSREEEFDLTYTWSLDGKTYSGTFKNISCAPENLAEQQTEQ